MQPHYVTLTIPSSAAATTLSAWQLIDWHVKPPTAIGLQGVSSGLAYSIQVTMDDPTGTYPNPTQPSSNPVSATFLSSQVSGGGIALGAANAIGYILSPIAALRLTSTSTSPGGGTATLTYLQQGIG